MSALDGVTVLDLTRQTPGGFCTMYLADFGAEVIKVEDTGAGDYLRWAQPTVAERPVTAAGTAFISLNRGKRSVRINLKEEAGREVFLRSVASADVVVDSYRPGVMRRLGIDYEVLRALNPRVIHCSLTGYGQAGTGSGRSGHDLNFIGRAGLLDLTGERPDGPPVIPGSMIADLAAGGLAACTAILLALLERQKSGQGQFLDISMTDGSLAFMSLPAAIWLNNGFEVHRGDHLFGGAVVCYRPYRCADGWVTLAAVERKFWHAFCAGVGREDLVDRQFDAVGSETHAAVENIFAGRTREEWLSFADEHDCCLDAVLSVAEATTDSLFVEREMITGSGDQDVRLIANPMHLSRTPPRRSSDAPVLGADTASHLQALGYQPEQIDALAASGAVALMATAPEGSFL